MMLARAKIVHWLLDGGKFSISARAMLATNFRAQILLNEDSAHSFGGFVRKLKFCTARNGRLLFMFIVAGSSFHLQASNGGEMFAILDLESPVIFFSWVAVFKRKWVWQ